MHTRRDKAEHVSVCKWSDALEEDRRLVGAGAGTPAPVHAGDRPELPIAIQICRMFKLVNSYANVPIAELD